MTWDVTQPLLASVFQFVKRASKAQQLVQSDPAGHIHDSDAKEGKSQAGAGQCLLGPLWASGSVLHLPRGMDTQCPCRCQRSKSPLGVTREPAQ